VCSPARICSPIPRSSSLSAATQRISRRGHRRAIEGDQIRRTAGISRTPPFAQRHGKHIDGKVTERGLLTSPALRCRQTLEPLAAALGLDPQSLDELTVDADVHRLVAILQEPRTDQAVLCTHGEVLQKLFGQLRAGAMLQGQAEPPWEKGSAWVLERLGNGFRGRYLAAPR
jgi:phosphohistidine phosphatase SixA